MKLLQFFNETKEVYDIYNRFDRAGDPSTPIHGSRRQNYITALYKIIDDYQEKGYEKHSGVAANVLVHPNKDTVIKIIKPSRVACMIQYYKLGRRNANKHIPKVYRIRERNVRLSNGKLGQDKIVIIEMEKLHVLDGERLRFTRNQRYNLGLIFFFLKDIARYASSRTEEETLYNHIFKYAKDVFVEIIVEKLFDNSFIHFADGKREEYKKRFKRYLSNTKTSKEFNHIINSALGDLIDIFTWTSVLKDYVEWWMSEYSNTPFVKALNIINQILIKCPSKQNARLDLHGANIMMRKDGTLVISDPIEEDPIDEDV